MIYDVKNNYAMKVGTNVYRNLYSSDCTHSRFNRGHNQIKVNGGGGCAPKVRSIIFTSLGRLILLTILYVYWCPLFF